MRLAMPSLQTRPQRTTGFSRISTYIVGSRPGGSSILLWFVARNRADRPQDRNATDRAGQRSPGLRLRHLYCISALNRAVEFNPEKRLSDTPYLAIISTSGR